MKWTETPQTATKWPPLRVTTPRELNSRSVSWDLGRGDHLGEDQTSDQTPQLEIITTTCRIAIVGRRKMAELIHTEMLPTIQVEATSIRALCNRARAPQIQTLTKTLRW